MKRKTVKIGSMDPVRPGRIPERICADVSKKRYGFLKKTLSQSNGFIFVILDSLPEFFRSFGMRRYFFHPNSSRMLP